jgi:hypothetical protein
MLGMARATLYARIESDQKTAILSKYLGGMLCLSFRHFSAFRCVGWKTSNEINTLPIGTLVCKIWIRFTTTGDMHVPTPLGF